MSSYTKRRNRVAGKPRPFAITVKITEEDHQFLIEEVDKNNFFNMAHLYREILATHRYLIEKNEVGYKKFFLNADACRN